MSLLTTPRLGAIFDRRLNGLNLLRLVFASAVIIYHSFPLTGRDLDKDSPVGQLMGNLWVDSFFAISGFLILGSWLSRPQVGRFLSARALRILPAFYVCLILTAFVLVPLGLVMSGSDGPLWSKHSWEYVYKNSSLWILDYDVGNATSELPYPGAINGSLWTLRWEFICYLGILSLGLVGLLKYRATIPLCMLGAWILLVAWLTGAVGNPLALYMGRLGLAFLSGSLIYLIKDRIPVSGVLLAVAGGIVLASSMLPNYLIIAAPFLAYLVIGIGAYIKIERLTLQNDISYGIYIYGFPVQQLMAFAGFAFLPVGVFAAVAIVLTIPLAAGSWFLIEKPAMGLLRRRQKIAIT